ncbi:YcxB family protein [Pengzhenrongella phosphoraccumulans]|uniref:YcxB family protein n=1 Tax=Pengzhenrongella phosphoraccumulans TaxID=3114394 RepID=UPI00388DC295
MTSVESPTIDLSWAPVAEDYVEALRAQVQRRQLPRKVAQILLAGALIGGAGWATGSDALAVVALVIVVGALLLLGAMPTLMARALWRRGARLRGATSVRVAADEGIALDRELFSGTYQWAMFTGVLETERLFVLQTAPRQGAVILLLAKRGLSSPEQLPALRALLEQQITPHANSAAR